MSWDLREPWKRSPPVSTSDSGAASPCDDAVSDVDAESSLTPASPGTNVGYIAMLSEILLIATVRLAECNSQRESELE